MRISMIALPILLLVASAGAQAQANRIPADRTPTAGVTETPTLPSRSGTSPATDSVMAGGETASLPGGAWDLGLGKAPTPPAPPGDGIKAPVFGRSYMASSSYSHDTRAYLDLEIAPDGTCTVTKFALKTFDNRKYSCGNVLDGASPSDVEVQFIADVYILNGTPPKCGNPFYTPSTDWIPLADSPKVHADTGLVIGGGSPCSGSREVSGNYTVRIRQKSTGIIVEGVMDFLVEADAFSGV